MKTTNYSISNSTNIDLLINLTNVEMKRISRVKTWSISQGQYQDPSKDP